MFPCSNHSSHLCTVFLTLLAATSSPALAADAPNSSSSRRLLFLDDHDVADIQNLKRTLHQPTKRGAVIHSSRKSETIQTRTAPVWDATAKVYKIWLLSTDRPLWISEDGLNWSPGPVPNLRTDHVVYDPHDPDPGRRFKAVQTNEYFAVSPDGVTWTKLPVEKIPSSDESNLSFDPEKKLFIHSVKRGTKFGRSVAIAVSRDFQNWDDYGLVFQSDELDQQKGKDVIRARLADPTLMPMSFVDEKVFRVDVYNMGVFHYEGLFVGMPAMFHATGPVPNYPNTDGFQIVQLAVSHDLKAWYRVCDRATFIGPSRLGSGAYDLTQILPPSAPVVHDDELWFYYTGLKYRNTFRYIGTYPNGHTEPRTDQEPDHGAICLAVLRRDGFVSLDGGEDEGFILTKPFTLDSESIDLNVKTHDHGRAVVELVDTAQKPIATSEPLEGDGVRLPVRWLSTPELKQQVGKQVQLKIRLHNASLFSIGRG